MNDDKDSGFRVEVANESHISYASDISETMEESARIRGTGIAKRFPQVLMKYMLEGNAVIAIHEDGRWAGFSYLSLWDNGMFVSHSGLIVAPEFRQRGVARIIKTRLFELSRKKYPNASIVGITTSAAVMALNTSLGFHATAFSEITKDPKFWDGCRSCVNQDILQRTGKKFCLCTAMRLDPDTRQLKLADSLIHDRVHIGAMDDCIS